ncbi:MAG: glucosaminidase domain-containing protein [Bacteroidales bacterium]|nr:glucosaminidase domain-containing protein [Bacteroidales bacterium]
MKPRFIIFALAPLLLISATGPSTPQERYIARYAAIAVSEMYRTGVPASITLAQGLLESRYGESSLAKDGNNHFGIKCHDWKGKTMYYDDDRKGECFRVYQDADQSFQDHSDFLRYRDRYKFLFENETTDYKAWAYGLKKAGYATDPAYPQKLIKYIEDYRLYEYDTMTVKQAEKIEEPEEPSSSGAPSSSPATSHRSRKGRKSKYVDDTQTTIPESPLRLEQPKKIKQPGAHETVYYDSSREEMSLNGVPVIRAIKGETVASIAFDKHLFDKELRRFNDLGPDDEIKPGDIVYLQRKKKQAAKGLEKYVVDKDGESLWAISQRFGIRLSTLRKLNSFEEGHVLREGDTVIMRDEPILKRLFRKK